MVEQIMGDLLVVGIEALEDVLVVHTVNNATGLPDGVHAQHGASHIDGLDAGP